MNVDNNGHYKFTLVSQGLSPITKVRFTLKKGDNVLAENELSTFTSGRSYESNFSISSDVRSDDYIVTVIVTNKEGKVSQEKNVNISWW